MPLRIYIAPVIGVGQPPSTPEPWTDTTGPYRSVITNFQEQIDHPGHRIAIHLVEGTSAELDDIEADSRVTPVVPLRANDMAHLKQILDAPFSSYPLAWRTAARNKLESWGFDTGWITSGNTMRDVIKKVVNLISVYQVASGNRLSNVLAFSKANLDSTFAQIPAVQRDEVASWLQGVGINTSWITGTTTVREVVRDLYQHLSALYGRSVLVRFAGEDM